VVLLPLLTVLVAGDAIAGEVSGGTLKTILGRSVGRSGLFWSKAVAVGLYTLTVVGTFVGVGLVAGWLAIGFRPLAGLGGAPIPVGQVLALIVLGAGLVALPLLALAAFALLLVAPAQRRGQHAVARDLGQPGVLRLLLGEGLGQQFGHLGLRSIGEFGRGLVGRDLAVLDALEGGDDDQVQHRALVMLLLLLLRLIHQAAHGLAHLAAGLGAQRFERPLEPLALRFALGHVGLDAVAQLRVGHPAQGPLHPLDGSFSALRASFSWSRSIS
jgi:hypothetical protein